MIILQRILKITAQHRTALMVVLLLLTAFAVRSWGRGWDGYTHQHPDERMLIMVADRIHFPDNLNPDFFNYGSLPIYILKGTAQILDTIISPSRPIASYDGLLRVGRTLSSIVDAITVGCVVLLGYLLTRRRSVGLLSGLLYAIAFFPVQNSHFFVVDVWLTLFVSLTAITLVYYLRTGWVVYALLAGVGLGLSMATKFSAVLFLPGIIAVVLVVRICWTDVRKRWTRSIRQVISHTILVIVTSGVVFALCMPYAILPPTGILTPGVLARDRAIHSPALPVVERYPGLLDLVRFLDPAYTPQTRFLRDIREQTRMNVDAYVFPYTLQYVTTQPYWYYLKQIVLWGMGPWISLLGVVGMVASVLRLYQIFSSNKVTKRERLILLPTIMMIILYGVYFVVIGRSAVKFMRYMLPLYPMIAVCAGYGLATLVRLIYIPKHRSSHRRALACAVVIGIACTILWSIAFVSIYSRTHTRIDATRWILTHIPAGSALAVEHWDDRVPIRYGERYQYEEMTIYDQPDTMEKWKILQNKLRRSDYIILASNRLYTPLPKLADCSGFRMCYPRAADYYRRLFDGSLGWRLVKEFSVYPQLGPWQIVDDTADESFTVYDHPKILIYARD